LHHGDATALLEANAGGALLRSQHSYLMLTMPSNNGSVDWSLRPAIGRERQHAASLEV
jgi:hypothetical protein